MHLTNKIKLLKIQHYTNSRNCVAESLL